GMGEDDVRGERDQLRRLLAHVVGVTAPAVIDADILTDGPTQLRKTLGKRREAGLRLRVIRRDRHQRAHASQSARRLPAGGRRAGGGLGGGGKRRGGRAADAGGKRQSGRAAEEGDELASSHGSSKCSQRRTDTYGVCLREVVRRD